jgi:mannose-1-phosphate guanylyltransferase/mannose-1-phosphate guanylyltransferase/phosphomannomutase
MSKEIKKAMILAAGEGTRLRPLTLETPKALLPIRGRALIEHQISWLNHHGIREIAINLYHLGNKIKDHLGDGSRFGMKICYSPEETLLGTAGGVKRIEHFFNDTFVVVYGDILTDLDLSDMVKFHREKKAVATLAIFEAPNPWEVGVVELNKERRILRLTEKPQSPVPSSQSPALANGGVYVLEKDVLNYIPAQGSSDFAYDIFPKLIGLGLPIYGYMLNPQDYCLIDIGTRDKYRKANEETAKFGV